MYCKNCGNKLVCNEKICSKCGTQNEFSEVASFSKLKTTYTLSLIIMIIDLLCALLYINEKSSMAGIWLIIAVLITIVPFCILIGLSIKNIGVLLKCQKNGANIPNKIKIVNVISIPTIVLIFAISIGFKTFQEHSIMKKNLDKHYGNTYEVLDKCSRGDEGSGANTLEYLLKLSNFEYPVLASFEFRQNEYSDNYDELIEAEKLNYQSYIDDVFKDKTIALMSISEYGVSKRINLEIIMPTTHLKNLTLLQYNIEQVINQYIPNVPEYYYNLKIYFTEKFDIQKKWDYYILLNSQMGNCYIEFTEKIERSNLQALSIYVYPDTNIQEQIKKGIDNIFTVTLDY